MLKSKVSRSNLVNEENLFLDTLVLKWTHLTQTELIRVRWISKYYWKESNLEKGMNVPPHHSHHFAVVGWNHSYQFNSLNKTETHMYVFPIFYINFPTLNYNLSGSVNIFSYKYVIKSGSHDPGTRRARVLGIYSFGPQIGPLFNDVGSWLVGKSLI